MTSPSEDNDEILSRHRIAGPSPELRDRILREAHDAWEIEEAPPDDIPWGFPVLRLAACLAISMLIVSFFNRTGSVNIAEHQPVPRSESIAYPQAQGISSLPGFASMNDPERIKRFVQHQRRVRELLASDG